AHLLGDETAWRLGRVSFNLLKHIDPVGTILLPDFLLLLHSPFMFGYAKPVPVNFRALRNPRRDMIWVAAPGPAMNIALAILAALAFHLIDYLPGTAAPGGRIAVGVLPDAVASPLARLEPYGMLILIGLLFIPPALGAQTGIDVNIIWRFIARSTDAIIEAILRDLGVEHHMRAAIVEREDTTTIRHTRRAVSRASRRGYYWAQLESDPSQIGGQGCKGPDQISNRRLRGLLRPRRERVHRRAAEQRTPVHHSITSLARAISLSGIESSLKLPSQPS